ncbi:3-isopropylmalate dehydrogenase [Candidatus Poribacteria bacterium]|nr:3-isopropylmalate dehydrogenase [Candidatus Poribacteria bacterium]
MKRIVVIPGDGIGPEIMAQAVKVLKAIENKYNASFQMDEALMGGVAYDEFGTCLPDSTMKMCKEYDAVLFGANGGPKWDFLTGEKRPERALAVLRKELELFINLRPVKVRKSLAGTIPLKPEIVGDGFDITLIRELIGGIYYGLPKEGDSERAVDSMIYTKGEVERISRYAFELARAESKKLTSVDKENMMEASKLWRSVVMDVSKNYPDVKLNHILVDNCAYQIVMDPRQFEIIVTGNMFGDILSDELGALAGSLGLYPSASIGYGKKGLYEPIHGTAPDIAGKGIANPIGTILSAALMLRHSFDMNEAADDMEQAVEAVLDKDFRTADIAEKDKKTVSTGEMGDLIVKEIE